MMILLKKPLLFLFAAARLLFLGAEVGVVARVLGVRPTSTIEGGPFSLQQRGGKTIMGHNLTIARDAVLRLRLLPCSRVPLQPCAPSFCPAFDS